MSAVNVSLTERERATVTRAASRAVSPFYASGVPLPRRACAWCRRRFYVASRTEETCSLACADARAAHDRLVEARHAADA